MHVNCDALVRVFTSVAPGLSTHGIVEQSKCFVFTGGLVRTFNEEISCCMPSPLGDFEGAIEAASFLGILNKMSGDELEVEFKEGEIQFKGKRRRLGVRAEQEILLPLDSIEVPKKWKPLPEDFREAVSLAKDCCSSDEQKFRLMCVHMTPEYVEACDNYHMLRFNVSVPVSEPVLVRASSIKYLIDFDMTEISETETWVHFRNPHGLLFSCRRWVEPYPDFSELIKVSGETVVLPGGMSETVEKAEVFSNDNADVNVISVTLREDAMKIEGRGIHGWYQEIKKVKYSGAPVTFNVLPKLFSKLSSYSTECRVDSNRLIVANGRFVYATSLELTS